MRRISYSLMLLALMLNWSCSQILQPAPTTAATSKQHNDGLINAASNSSETTKQQLTTEQQQQFMQAKQLMQQQKYQQALVPLQTIVAVTADFAGVWYNLALCQWQLQQTSQAEYSLQQALIAQPKFSASLNLLGILAREQGQFGQAEQYWLQAIQLSDAADSHKNLGILYELYLNQLAKAQTHYQHYYELSQDPQAKLWLALIERQLPISNNPEKIEDNL